MKIKRDFSQIPRIPRSKIVPAMTEITRSASIDIKDEIQRLTPVDTGLMQRSWRRRVTNTTRKVVMQITNSAPYAGHVHYKGQPSRKVLEAAQRRFSEMSADLADDINERITRTITKEP